MMRSRISQLFLLALFVTASVMMVSADASAMQDGTNLLVNGGFEWPYDNHAQWDGGGFVAHGWKPWWYNDAGDQYDAPEFKGASIEEDASRVRDGVVAQQYFKPWARHLAGLYQQVRVPANSHVRFTVWGHAWASFCLETPEKLECDPRNSAHGGAASITMKIGIDPSGGTDWSSSNVIWSGGQAAYDNFAQFAIEADARGDLVTVFVYSSPEWGAPVINVYWDNAVLTATGGSNRPANPTAVPRTGGTLPPPAAGDAIATQAPEADGSQWHTVQPGESLGVIALAYGVDPQTIRAQNQMTTDVIQPGQKLLIRPAPVSPTAAQTQPSVPTATPPLPQATAIAEQAAVSVGEICVILYRDANGDGMRTAGEESVAGAAVTLTGQTTQTDITYAANQPTCFSALPVGDYQIGLTAPDGYTVPAATPVTLTPGNTVNLNIAAVQQAAADTEEESAAGLPRMAIVAAVGGIGLILLASGTIAIVIVYLRYKQHPTQTNEPNP